MSRSENALEKWLNIQEKDFTMLVDIIFTLPYYCIIEHSTDIRLLSHNTKALGQNDKLVSRNAVFLDRLRDDFLAKTVRVYVRGIPRIQSSVVCSFEER